MDAPSSTDRTIARCSLVGLVLASAPVTWWLVGDLSEAAGEDLMVAPPGLTAAQSTAIGVAGVLLLSAASVALATPSGRRGIRRVEVLIAAPLIVLGAYTGFTYRVLTAEVTGANIGAGLMLMLGFVLVPTMLIISVGAGFRARGIGRGRR